MAAPESFPVREADDPLDAPFVAMLMPGDAPEGSDLAAAYDRVSNAVRRSLDF